MTQDEKLDEALKGTFPASDAFYVSSGPILPAGGDDDPSREILEQAGIIHIRPTGR